MKRNTSNRDDREQHVNQMLTSLRLVGFEPDKEDKLLLHAYIDDRVSLNDLLAHSRQFMTLATYEEWQRTAAQSTIDNHQAGINHYQVMDEMRASIIRKQKNRRKAMILNDIAP
jgi:hypothetical protein